MDDGLLDRGFLARQAVPEGPCVLRFGASVRAPRFQCVDERTIPPAVTHGLHRGFFAGPLALRLLDQRASRAGSECEQAVLVTDDQIAWMHDHSTDSDWHIDCARAILVGTTVVDAARIDRKGPLADFRYVADCAVDHHP